MMNAQPATPLIGVGQIQHVRLKPCLHSFSYKGYFWMLPMRSMSSQQYLPVARNRRAMLSFHDRDHGDGRADSLTWLDELLAQAGIDVVALQQGEVWLQTFPRVLGVVFKPVSFWWVHAPDKTLVAVVAEVNNTFGERHAYVLDVPQMGDEVLASKVFHVSPFCQTTGTYRFRFMRTGEWGVPTKTASSVMVNIDHEDGHGKLLHTSQSGVLLPLTAKAARRIFFNYPLMTWGVIWKIHWQALLLWLKGVPLVSKPAPPQVPWSR